MSRNGCGPVFGCLLLTLATGGIALLPFFPNSNTPNDDDVAKVLKSATAAAQLESMLRLERGSLSEQSICDIENGALACTALEQKDPQLYRELGEAFENGRAKTVMRLLGEAQSRFLSVPNVDVPVIEGSNYTYRDMADIMGKLEVAAQNVARDSPAPPSVTGEHPAASRSGRPSWEDRHPRSNPRLKEDTRGFPPRQ